MCNQKDPCRVFPVYAACEFCQFSTWFDKNKVISTEKHACTIDGGMQFSLLLENLTLYTINLSLIYFAICWFLQNISIERKPTRAEESKISDIEYPHKL